MMSQDDASQRDSKLPPPPMTQFYESEIVLHQEPRQAEPAAVKAARPCAKENLIKPTRLSFSNGASWSISAPKPVAATIVVEPSVEPADDKKVTSLPSFNGPTLQFPGMQTSLTQFNSRHLEFPDN